MSTSLWIAETTEKLKGALQEYWNSLEQQAMHVRYSRTVDLFVDLSENGELACKHIDTKVFLYLWSWYIIH